MSKNLKMKNVRDSNMELLRIVAMLLVMIVHADFASLSVPTIEQCNASPLISFMRFFVEGLAVVAVNTFILLSGWYGIRPSIEKFVGFIFQTFFLMFVVYMCFVCWGEGVNHRYGEWIKISLFYQYWFVQSYILLFIFSPILNASVKMLERRTLFLVLTSLFVTQIVYGFLPCANNYGWYNNGYSPLTFFFLYLLARYVRLYGSSLQRFNSLFFFSGWVLMALIIAILGFLMICNGSGGYYYSYSSPFVIIGALLLLLAFTRIRINSSIINWVASSAFAAYIVHCHECIFDPLYKSYISRWFGEDPSYVFLGKTIIFILFLFILSILIDKIRMLIWNSLLKFISKIMYF